ncbi:uncharacterized protein Pyn_25511 [Prunus yedoensis var. nudiflora]|uniref:Uncharacterized protein n=1 Tax=Prunus yedoensis var. nudiflora TaxID=2094558 RepID=A0A314ZR71_PRUYE|nr:uncharacterized protein Pyn_25511 [Prunus yedoensis var. nudiflora]
MEDKGIFSEEIVGRDQHTGLVVGEEEEESLGRDEGLKSEEYDALNANFLKGKVVPCYEVVADQQGLNLPFDSEYEIAKKKHVDSEVVKLVVLNDRKLVRMRL